MGESCGKRVYLLMYRGRVWALGFLLAIYLSGILLISSITLHAQNEPEKRKKHSGRPMELAGMTPRRLPLRWCQRLHYRSNAEARPVTALISFPGSGNTWLRYLLQQATGIYTGSIYADYGLKKNGFPAESIVNSSVSVVKTHEWGEKARQNFDRAVILVRSPEAAIQAEFNRQSAGHIGFASPDKYKGRKGQHWEQFVINKLYDWTKLHLDWLFNFAGPKHIVFYEELTTNLTHSLRGLLDFLEIPVTESQMQCVVERREGIYRRKPRNLPFDPFTPRMKYLIENEKVIVYGEIHKFLQQS